MLLNTVPVAGASTATTAAFSHMAPAVLCSGGSGSINN